MACLPYTSVHSFVCSYTSMPIENVYGYLYLLAWNLLLLYDICMTICLFVEETCLLEISMTMCYCCPWQSPLPLPCPLEICYLYLLAIMENLLACNQLQFVYCLYLLIQPLYCYFLYCYFSRSVVIVLWQPCIANLLTFFTYAYLLSLFLFLVLLIC